MDVYTAKGGTEGVKKIEELQPDLIFLELMISFPNGFDILEQFKNKVIVVVSQLTQESDKERALGLGAKEYIAKEGLPTRAIVQTAFNFLNK